ncbi:MAG: hypothetical protein RIB84_23945 [Sneathiellaceae bacterium]
MQVLDYGGLGIGFLSVATWGYFERRRADKLAEKNDLLEAEIRAMLKEQTPLMTGLIRQGDRIEEGHKAVTVALGSVREGFATLRAELSRGASQ